jgi:DNA polymerase I
MWILDSVARNGVVNLWDTGSGSARRIQKDYRPPFYLHLADPHLHREMIEALESSFEATECRLTTIFGELDGYAVVADRAVAEKIEEQASFAVDLFNVDTRRDQQYMAEQGIFPCGNPGDSRFSASIAHSLRQMEISLHGNPATDREIRDVGITFEERAEHLSGSEQVVLADLFSLVESCDPDVVLCAGADLHVPRMVRKIRKYRIPFTLSRTGRYRTMDSRSYWSYGRVEHKEGAVIPDGRVLIDTDQSFVYREGGLEGVLIGARLSGLSPNLVSRFTPGTLISSYEVYEALRRRIVVPFRKSDAEKVRQFANLKTADKGGMMFQPRPGVYEWVYEIDFTSLYPSIIVQSNLSPETIEHPDRQGFLATVLDPLLTMRISTKQQKKVDPASEGIDAILKWMLVTCFGYTGYRNAKFGRIEVHEGITGRAREILLQTKDIAEAMDFSVLHGIVDCLWVQGSSIGELKARVEKETRLLTEVDTYSWLVFLPMADGYFGAYNRYYGRQIDGSIKVRGIAARRHDTPDYVRRMQKDMLEIMSRAESVAELRELGGTVNGIYQRYCSGIWGADVQEFVISRRISRFTYAHRCLEASAVQAYRERGIGVAPGMKITYVVKDAKKYLVEPEWDASVVDAAYYRGLLDKAWAEIAFVFEPAGGQEGAWIPSHFA